MSPLDPKDQSSTDAAEPSAASSSQGLPALDDQVGPAEPLSQDAQQALVQAAIAAAFPLPPPPAGDASTPSTAPAASNSATVGSLGRLARRGFLAAGAVGLVGAGAALWSRERGLLRSRPGSAAGVAPASPMSPAVPTVAPSRDAQGASAVDSAPSRPSAAIEAKAPAAPPASRASETSSSPRVASDRKGADASDLLQRANERRRQGRFAEAVAIYQQVLSRYPGSDAAYVARVSAGMLYVDRLRDPGRARALFQGALKQQPRGALHEEARLGLAEAWRALGDAKQERAALQDFLRHHPQALARPQAERRLQALEAN